MWVNSGPLCVVRVLLSCILFWFQVANDKCTQKQTTASLNANQLIFDIHNEASALLLKGYVNIQLSWMILKVTDTGKRCPPASEPFLGVG